MSAGEQEHQKAQTVGGQAMECLEAVQEEGGLEEDSRSCSFDPRGS